MTRQAAIVWVGFAMIAIGLTALFGWPACLIAVGIATSILAAAGYFG